MSEVDRAATNARKFKHPKSRVMRDGREILIGADWLARKLELWERCGGRCEYEQPWKVWPWGGPAMERCTRECVIPAHVIPRHPDRDDRMHNLRGYCFEHDRLTEKQSWRRTRFGEKNARPEVQ